jgi:SSS family transporter
MALSLANVASPDLKLPYEAANLFSAGPTYAVLTAFAVLFLILTVIWYRKVPAASSQTAEWFLTAGRNMKSGIVAASIVCTWTWAATLMVSSAKGYQHGIAGPYWYAAGATTPLLLFAVLAVYLKRRAPMAHTFGEFVRHRFGGPSHRLMLCLGLMSCVIVTAMVVLGGASALRTLTGLDIRVAVLVIPLAFAFYSAIGGLRGSIIVEYVQMVILMLIALGLTIWFWTSYGDLGIFERLSALAPREGETYLALASLSALLFGIVNTIGNLGAVFMDQTYWQRAIAASKESAGRSFLIGGLTWFAIPFGVATALGVGGLALGFAVPFPYTDIAPTTAAAVFGPLGTWLFLIMLFMAIVSTGNAESVAVASLVATDIYKTYVRPQACDGDILRIARRTTLAFALLIGPACLALHTLAIDMGWLYLTMGIFVGAGVIPLALGLLTDRLTGRGAYWATLGGLVIGLMGWMTAAHELEGAITLETLGRLRPVTIGNLSVILTSGLICALDCWRPHARFRFEQLRDAIRSYLETHESPSPQSSPRWGEGENEGATLTRQERRLVRWVVGSTIFLELIVPGGLYLSGIQFGAELFAVWVILSLVWLLLATGFIVLLPIKDHFEIEYPEWQAPKLVEEHGWRTAVPASIGNRLFLSFLTVVLTLGIGAVVSLVKLGSIEHLRGANERVITEEALHEDMVFSMIPQVLEERRRGERDGLAASALSERVKLLASSPYTPSILHAMISSPEPQGPIRYLSFGEKERAFLAGSIARTYRGTRLANISRLSQQRRQAIVLILISLIGTLTVGLILTIRTSAAITRPIRRLAEASRRFAAGNPPAPPMPVDTADEIGVLTEEFNAMAVRIREQVTALKAAEEEFRLIVSHVSDAIVYLDLAGIVRWANHQAVVISGRSMEEMVGQSFMAVLAPEAAARAEARLAAIRRGESVPPLVEFEVLRPDGSVVWIEANITSVLEDGKVVGRLLVARDITERKRAEEMLRESEAFKNRILESSPDCIKVLDLEGRLLFMSRGGMERLEISDDAPFLNSQWVEFWKGEDKQKARAAIEAARTGGVGRFIGFYPTATGKPKWWDVFITPLLDASGKPDRLLSISRDITERKRAEEALRESEQRLSQLLEDRERISRDLHDNIIQTLYAIGLGIEESQRLFGENSKPASSNLSNAIKELNSVIRDVRSYIAWSEPKVLDGRQLKAAIERLARTMEGAHLLHFSLKVDQEAADRLTPEEARHVLYIAREAMSNSLRHSKARDGIVSLQVSDKNICLTVADAGDGFDTTNPERYGQGLRNIAARAQKLDARLQIVSEPGLGVRIVLDIPKVKKHASA